MGYGLLAFFGEDDPKSAVRCGLALVRAIDELDLTKHLTEAEDRKSVV